LDVNGVEGSPETTDAQALIWQVEYGLTDKIAVHGSLPYIFGRYQGENPHTVGRDLQPSDLDDGTYHSAFQDFYFGVRYGVLQKPGLAIAPFVEAIVPSHRYETLAQAAVGRDERLLLVGTAVGGFLDNILPGLHYQTRVSYGIAQKVVNIRTNRTGTPRERRSRPGPRPRFVSLAPSLAGATIRADGFASSRERANRI
jgi:hypothetical protein